jgi:hypothetical protein
MTAKQEYWLVDEISGEHALVVGADERDRLVRDGWAETAELAGDGTVRIWHEGIETPGLVSKDAYEGLWRHRGWVPGPPPGGVNPADPEAPAEAEEAKPTIKPASGGSNSKGTDR